MKRFLVAALLVLSASAFAQDLPIRPDANLTPGLVLTTDTATICVPGYSKTVRHTAGSLKAKVYAAYGITKEQRTGGTRFEIDHLISLELGGADVFENLWPEAYTTSPWNASVKDKLEDHLHREVCAGRYDLKQAQAEIAADWIALYQKLLGQPKVAAAQ